MDLTQKKYNILISLFLTVLYFVLVQLISGFIFFLNDDRTLQFILSGHASEPSFYTFFLSWFLAMPLAGLYSLFPTFPFYGFIMLSSIFISLWYLTHFIIKKQKNIILSLVLIVLMYICIYRIVCRPTFTLAAAFMIMPVILIVLEFSFDNKNDAIKNIILLCLFCLLSIGFRQNVFLLSLPFVALIIVLKIIKANKKLLLLIPIFVSCFAFSFIGNIILQKNPEYKQAIEYSEIRSEIFDHYGMPEYYSNEELYISLGISNEAYNMILNYCFDIPEASIENLTAIRNYQKEHSGTNFGNNFYDIYQSYLDNKELLCLVGLLFILSLTANLKGHLRELLLILGFFFGTILLSFAVDILMKFPTRIASTLLLFNLSFCIYAISNIFPRINQSSTTKQWITKAVSMMLVIVVFCCTFFISNSAYDNTWKNQITNDFRAFEQHASADSEYIYYTYSTVNLHYSDAPLRENQRALNCIICDWNYLLPSYNQFFKNHGAKNLTDYIEQGKKLKFVITQYDVITECAFYKYLTNKYGKAFIKTEDFKTYQIYEII